MKAFYLLLALLPLALAKPACECPLVNCLGDDAARCKCANEAAVACAARCSSKPTTRACPTPTSTKPPLPTQTVCDTKGLSRKCNSAQTCIPNPKKLGCSSGANCPGICVQLNGPRCGGFAGFQCPDKDHVCVDDPRDDCGGPGSADCIGVCVRLDGSSSASQGI
ncbi:hypothetical protein XPA_006216 [Xanthoria parietina]